MNIGMTMGRGAMQAGFFDRLRTKLEADDTVEQPLSKMGAFVRRTAKGSIRQAAAGKLKKVAEARRAYFAALRRAGQKATGTSSTPLSAAAKARLKNLPRSKSKKKGKLSVAQAFAALQAAQAAVSAPAGKPPRSIKGFLRDNIFFAWDSESKTVVVGPAALGAAVAPGALEYGGQSVTKYRQGGFTISRTVNVRPHPFMHPAFVKEQPKFPELFKNFVSRAA